jgi:2-aminoadipate transaminase
MSLGKQGADLCSSSVTQLFVAQYFEQRGARGGPAWLEYVEDLRDHYRSRRDVMVQALSDHFGDGASWTHPGGGLFVWATLDERIDTTDLLALARKTEGVAFVPGRAAYVDGRRGASSMRLNFAGVPEEEIREGIGRIGRAMRQQLALLGSLTAGRRDRDQGGHAPRTSSGEANAAADAPGDAAADPGSPLADVVELPRRGNPLQARRTRDR